MGSVGKSSSLIFPFAIRIQSRYPNNNPYYLDNTTLPSPVKVLALCKYSSFIPVSSFLPVSFLPVSSFLHFSLHQNYMMEFETIATYIGFPGAIYVTIQALWVLIKPLIKPLKRLHGLCIRFSKWKTCPIPYQLCSCLCQR